MSILARCAAIDGIDKRRTKLHLLPYTRPKPVPAAQRVFGPFSMKFKEQIYDDVEMENPSLTPEEFAEMLRLERWGYVELILSEDGNSIRLGRYFPSHLPDSPFLRAVLPRNVMGKVYEPHFNDVLAARVEHCVATDQPVTRARITEPEKLIMILRCSWLELWDKLITTFRRTPLL